MYRVACIAFLVLVSTNWLCWQVTATNAQGKRSAQSASEPETVSLTTKDGVQLKASYYPSDIGKDAVPVVMLHDYKESRAVFNGIARALQSAPEGERPSHAVLTVDLRGHGESTTVQSRTGQIIEIDVARLGQQDFRDMVRYDMEAVRKLLVEKNDNGELNLNKLCLIGSGMGANVATAWSAVDWSAPKLANRKQGQDVKGLVLVSPEWSYQGLPMLKPLRNPGVSRAISMLIIYGKEDRQSEKSAETIFKNLERFHPEPPPERRREEQDLFLVGLPTSLKGSRLLADPSFQMLPIVEQFLDTRLSQQDYPWVERRLRD